MGVEIWETLKQAILAYTGLSPATFFTIIALSLGLYHVISGLFASPFNNNQRRRSIEEEEMVPLPPPVQLGEITEEELKQFDGNHPQKPLLMAIKSQIYDVSQSRMFYGPGGPYALFAGKDASRALAKMSFEEKDLTGDISGLSPFELEALQDWEYKFMGKYTKVGTIKTDVSVTEPSSSEPTEPVEATDREAPKQAEDDSPKLAEDDSPKLAEDDSPKLAEDGSSDKPAGEEAVETSPAVDTDKKDE